MSEKLFRIYREKVSDKNLIGNLPLDTIKLIHGTDIFIHHGEGFVLVKRDPKYTRAKAQADADNNLSWLEGCQERDIKKEDREYSERQENAE